MGKHPESGKDLEQEEKEGTEDEMVWWHHWLKGHESEQTLGDGEEQGNLECCSPWGCKESDTTEQVNNKNNLYENITLYTLKRYHFLGGVFCVALLIGKVSEAFTLVLGTFTRHLVTLLLLLQTPPIINHIHDYNILLSPLGSFIKSLNLKVLLPSSDTSNQPLITWIWRVPG